jgi:hypothetical protein
MLGTFFAEVVLAFLTSVHLESATGSRWGHGIFERQSKRGAGQARITAMESVVMVMVIVIIILHHHHDHHNPYY